jgi:hypothetical protein
MRAHYLSAAFALVFIPALAYAGHTEWRRYVIPSTGTSVEMPVTIFTKDAGSPEGGTGRRFLTDDNRADLTLQFVPNPDNDSPAAFLASKNPPGGLIYKASSWNRVGDFGLVSRLGLLRSNPSVRSAPSFRPDLHPRYADARSGGQGWPAFGPPLQRREASLTAASTTA